MKSSQKRTTSIRQKPIPKNLPRIIAFANQKGGAGKSTGATHAVDWLKNQNIDVLLVDADAQQSSSSWLKELELAYEVISDPEELFEKLPILAQHHDVVVVDGPGSLSEVTKAILARADLVLIPSRETFLDLKSTGKILQYVRHAHELRHGEPKTAIYLNAVSKGSVLLREAEAALATRSAADDQIYRMKNSIYDRTCIKDSPGQGSTVFRMRGKPAKDAAENYNLLFREALEFFNGKEKKP
jgi:chromosome partitioning protein